MSVIRTITTCEMCGKQFTGPTFAMVGSMQADQETVRYAAELNAHIIKEHRDQAIATENRSLEFLTMLRLLLFRTTDSALRKQIQFLRWQISQQTLAVRMKDENIDKGALQFSTSIVDMFIAEIGSVFGTGVLKMLPRSKVEILKTRMTAKIAESMTTETKALRDLYEEPGKWNITVVEVPKDEPDPEPSPKKPLLVLPD